MEIVEIDTPLRKEWLVGGRLHRDDGPAVVWTDGSEEWYQHGKRHCDDGPAVVNTNGTKEWYQYGQRHRPDGPAILWYDGSEEWYQHGKLHRLDGPAVVDVDVTEEWWIDGEQQFIIEVEPNVLIIQGDIENNYPSLEKIGNDIYRIGDEDLCLLRLKYRVMQIPLD